MKQRTVTHEIRIPDSPEVCDCHNLPITWDGEMWRHTNGTEVPLEGWPPAEELHLWPTDEDPHEEGYGPVAVLGPETLRGWIDDGDDEDWLREEWFVCAERCLAIKVDDIPDEWLHEVSGG